MSLADDLEVIAGAENFSGVALVTRGSEIVAEIVRGDADRANRRAVAVDTRFGVASVTKGFTAVATAAVAGSGQLSLDAPVRDVLGDRLPSIDDRVSLEHLLGHTSGIGDYLDEEQLGDIDEHVLDRSAHHFERPLDYLPIVDGYPQRSDPGTTFAYNNGGYVVVSIVLELVTGRSFHDLVTEHVLAPARMDRSGFFRSDELPADTALGYLASGRTNVFHLPVRGAGDGGLYSTAPDLLRFWAALIGGRLAPSPTVDRLTTSRATTADGSMRYGLGFWRQPSGAMVRLEGMDAGVSCRTGHDPVSDVTYAVVSNTSNGAWALAAAIEEFADSVSRASDVGGDPSGSR
jgi:CubicO group peptidase (beta-lactamase class C family)